jgi:hypothetical protein
MAQPKKSVTSGSPYGAQIPPFNELMRELYAFATTKRTVRSGGVAKELTGAVRRMRTSLRYPNPTCRSGNEKAAPLGESGGSGLLVGVAVLEVALRWKVVVDRGMN